MKLPQEILERIAKYCDTGTLLNLCKVNLQFSKIFNQRIIWQSNMCPIANIKKWMAYNYLKRCWYCHKKTRDRCILLDCPSCYECHKKSHDISGKNKKFERLMNGGKYVDYFLEKNLYSDNTNKWKTMIS